jgi:hypothetical protein
MERRERREARKLARAQADAEVQQLEMGVPTTNIQATNSQEQNNINTNIPILSANQNTSL